MRAESLLMSAVATGLLLILSCGGSPPQSETGAVEKSLPPEYPQLGLVRDGDILHFAGDSLFNYINGAAEMYHKYDFVEVHVAKYRRGGGEITVDIYRFAADDLAFGMYSTLRPDEPDAVELGAEGFTFGPVLIFAKDPYMVNVQTYDDAVFRASDIQELAAAVDENLPGSTRIPATFGLFPEEGRVPQSEKVVAEAFLGRGFLTEVYTVDYYSEDDKTTFFMAADERGEKLKRWLEVAPPEQPGADVPSGLLYDEGMAAVLEESYYGHIIAGVAGGRLTGIVGYTPSHEQALRKWLDSLPAPNL